MAEAGEQRSGAREVQERLGVTGEQLMRTVQRLAREGNVRRIRVKSAAGRQVLDLPLTAGVVGAVLLPVWVMLGALGAMAAGYSLEVVRRKPEAKVQEAVSTSQAAGSKPVTEEPPPVH